MDRKQAAVAAVMALATVWAWSSAEAAQPFGRHPALGGGDEALLRRIDPNRFIPAHPAGLRLLSGHANHEHPAVATAREPAGILDPNGFLVQPPASVQWVTIPADQRLAQSTR